MIDGNAPTFTEAELCRHLDDAYGLRNLKEEWISRQRAFPQNSLVRALCNTDIRELSHGSLLWSPQDAHSVRLGVQTLVQIDEVTNVAAPDRRAPIPTLLQFVLSDGAENFIAFELDPAKSSFTTDTVPGTKLILLPSALVRRGRVILTSADYTLLGSPQRRIRTSGTCKQVPGAVGLVQSRDYTGPRTDDLSEGQGVNPSAANITDVGGIADILELSDEGADSGRLWNENPTPLSLYCAPVRERVPTLPAMRVSGNRAMGSHVQRRASCALALSTANKAQGGTNARTELAHDRGASTCLFPDGQEAASDYQRQLDRAIEIDALLEQTFQVSTQAPSAVPRSPETSEKPELEVQEPVRGLERMNIDPKSPRLVHLSYLINGVDSCTVNPVMCRFYAVRIGKKLDYQLMKNDVSVTVVDDGTSVKVVTVSHEIVNTLRNGLPTRNGESSERADRDLRRSLRSICGFVRMGYHSNTLTATSLVAETPVMAVGDDGVPLTQRVPTQRQEQSDVEPRLATKQKPHHGFSSVLRARELGHFVNMPSLGNLLGGLRTSLEDEFGFWTVSSVGTPRAIPPFSISFSTTALYGHALLAGDEEGIITILDTRRSLRSQMHAATPATQPYSRFRGHDNAIFDATWLSGDEDIATAGGDATVRVFDARSTLRKAVLRGAMGSVKSVRSYPLSRSVLVSAARDGDVRIYDIRVPSVYDSRVARENYHRPVSSISQPHANQAHAVQGRKRRRIQAAPPKLGAGSVTSLAFQPGEPLLYTAGAADGSVKLWDLRLGKDGCKVQGCLESATPGSERRGEETRRVHGIAALDVDPTGKLVLASSTDSQIFLYHAKQLGLGNTQVLNGHTQTSFYIRAKFSNCGRFVASGSADTKAYIWDSAAGGAIVHPILELDGHRGGEVSGIDWCRGDGFKLATCADDSTVKVWRVSRGAKAGVPRAEGDESFNGARRVVKQMPSHMNKQFGGSRNGAGTCRRKLKNADIRSFFSQTRASSVGTRVSSGCD